MKSKPVAKKLLFKQRPLLGNVRDIHATVEQRGIRNPFISNRSVNMFPRK
jgi:hypothetical protein